MAPPPLPRRSSYELRPLTTGEVLDRTFFLYRNHFWLFVGLSAVSAAVATLTSIVQQVYLHFSKAGPDLAKPAQPILFAHFGSLMGISVAAGLLYLVVYSVTQAATVSAVTSIYLGDATSMRQAFQAVTGRWFRYFAIALWQAWSGVWLYLVLVGPALVGVFFLARRGAGASASAAGLMAGLGLLMFVGGVGGLVYGVIAYIRNSLAVPAEVMEGLTIRAAMKRSKVLAAGSKGRIFLLFLLLGVLGIVVLGVETPLAILIAKARGGQVLLMQATLLFVNFIVRSVVAPVGAIGLCLFYIDQRVRKEGFDLEFLIDRSKAVEPHFSYPVRDQQELP